MDPYKLLSRSTRLTRPSNSNHSHSKPSSGANTQPQLFPSDTTTVVQASRKRKRGTVISIASTELDFFGTGTVNAASDSRLQSTSAQKEIGYDAQNAENDDNAGQVTLGANSMTIDESKSVLHNHKLKVTWLNPTTLPNKDRQKSSDKKERKDKQSKVTLYPQPMQSFVELRSRLGMPTRLVTNIEEQGYSIPTEVQMAAVPLLLRGLQAVPDTNVATRSQVFKSALDLLTVAPTGSGKTLAFMIPLLSAIGQKRRQSTDRSTSAIVLAPTKELAGQIVNEARKLAKGTGMTVSQVRKGMQLAKSTEAQSSDRAPVTVVKSDILVSTPGTLATVLERAHEQHISSIRHLILDEADVLLDPLFREQTLAIWNALPSSDLRVSLWSATMGSSIEELARMTIKDRTARLAKETFHGQVEVPFVRLVVGLKDSAVPNVEHRLVYAASEQGKLMGLRQLLHPSTTPTDADPPLLPPFLVFTQTIERAVALHSELLYDIPAEAGGISRIAVLHSDLSDSARDSVMTRFRKGEVWVLITTDLLSRGVDFRGVNGVVNYDIPTSSAAYVHRVGRTGRAGREGGVAVTLYSKEDIPFLKPIANLIATAQQSKGTSDATGVQPWLLESLPSLTKKSKQDLRKHGVESRTARGRDKDPQAARKARISTKAGWVRREENKRKGAIQGSRHRQEAAASNDGEDTDFDGFV